jgi:hypothetical protein
MMVVEWVGTSILFRSKDDRILGGKWREEVGSWKLEGGMVGCIVLN